MTKLTTKFTNVMTYELLWKKIVIYIKSYCEPRAHASVGPLKLAEVAY